MLRHVDYFPTLATIAGAEVPDGLDGRSMLPLLTDPDAKWEDRYTVFHLGRWFKEGAPGRWGKGATTPESYKYKGFAVRNERWRLVGKDPTLRYSSRPGPGDQRNQATPRGRQRDARCLRGVVG